MTRIPLYILRGGLPTEIAEREARNLRTIRDIASECGITGGREARFSLYINGRLAEGVLPTMQEAMKHFRGVIPKRQIDAFYERITFVHT